MPLEDEDLGGLDEDELLDGELDEETEDDAAGEDGEQQEQAAGEEQAEGEEAPVKKPLSPREQRRRERGRNLVAARDAEIRQLREQLHQVSEAVGRSAQASERVAESVTASLQPKAKPLEARLTERLEATARAVKEGDDASARRLLAEYVEVAKEIGSEQGRAAAREEVARLQAQMPRQPTPEAQALLMKAPWLNDPGHRAAVKSTVERIASARRVNFDSAPRNLQDAIIEQALANYATFANLPLNGSGARRAPARPGMVAGAGGRMNAGARGGGGQTVTLTTEQKRMVDASGFMRDAPPEKRYAEFSKRHINR